MKLLLTLGLIFIPAMAFAADLGVDGETWPISEPDLIESIRAELTRAEQDGRMARFNDQVSGQARSALFDPPSLALPAALNDKTWLHDPSVIVQRDIHTHLGVLIAARGTRINPLERVSLQVPLLFVNGTISEQMEWALAQEGKIILLAGSPKSLMDEHDRRMYFDQRKILTNRFGFNALPARISQEGLALRVEEIALQPDEVSLYQGGTDG
jgi:conjugal transfer pilus assembly protein TraW